MTHKAPAGVLLPLTSDELAHVDAAATSAGLTRHQWIRRVLLRKTAPSPCAFCRGSGFMAYAVPESRTRAHEPIRGRLRCPASCPIPTEQNQQTSSLS